LIAILAIMPSWLQLESINASGSRFSERLDKQLSDVETGFSQRLPMLRAIHLTTEMNKLATEYGGRVFEDLPRVITTFTVNLLLVPLIAYFMVRDGRKLRRRVVSLVPNRYFEMALIVM